LVGGAVAAVVGIGVGVGHGVKVGNGVAVGNGVKVGRTGVKVGIGVALGRVVGVRVGALVSVGASGVDAQPARSARTSQMVPSRSEMLLLFSLYISASKHCDGYNQA
jgi:hypothetical protein